jgi:segregation and condensation protein A
VTTNSTTYTVALPIFEGPLDLLLHLIEREELEITAVSVAQVTGQYLAYLTELHAAEQSIHPDALADFLVMAARLIWIKSRALLPRPPAVEEEEEDPAATLALQLREYKRFKEAAQHLRAREADHHVMYVRVARPPLPTPRLLAGQGQVSDLWKAMQRALHALPPVQPADLLVAPLPFTVHDKIDLITQLTTPTRTVHFDELLALANSRVEIVITLLAVLELMKRRQIVVEQSGLFGEILIRAAAPPSPQSPI